MFTTMTKYHFDLRNPLAALFIQRGIESPAPGVFVGDLNLNLALSRELILDDFAEVTLPDLEDGFKERAWGEAFWVADSVEEFLAEYGHVFEADPRKLALFCCVMTKEHDGDWRWHKWGRYVGKGEPTAEHLRDEEHFDQIVTIHCYEMAI